MARYLFTVLPALGHINPTLPIAVELQKRGHEVGYAVGLDFKDAIESAGLRFFAAGPPGLKTYVSPAAQKMLNTTGLISHSYFFELLAENNEQTITDLRAIVEQYQPDVIVTDSITHAGAQAAEIYNIPWATNHAVPGLIPTKDGPPFTTWGLPPSDSLPAKIVYSVIRFGQTVFFRLFDPRFNRIRAAQGLPKVKTCCIDSCLSPYLMLVPTCEGFEYTRSDWPPQSHLIGPAPWGKSSNNGDAFAWIDELPEDKPLIYITLGTIQVFRTLEFFNIAMQALQDEPCRVIMSVGPAVDMNEFKNIPDNFHLERFVPHAKILPRADAVIHHGGQNIAQDCIYHGLPSVVVPISQDLFEVARRCSAAGVSVRIPYQKLTSEKLRNAVRTALNDSSISENTQKLQRVFRDTNAGHTGATLLEQLASTKAPVYRA